MKWFKHDTNANMDAKLQEVLLDYGLEGYGLYWYCLELIAGNVAPEKLTFELEHDCRIIARNTGTTPQKVQEMMTKFIGLGLFEESQGRITCLKLAKASDDYTAKLVRSKGTQVIDFKENRETPTKTDKVPLEQNKTKQNREEKEDIKSSPPAKPKAVKFNDQDLMFAEQMYQKILGINPSHKKPNFDIWADDIRKARVIDGRDLNDLWAVFEWANSNDFWCKNILSADKLRKQYDRLSIDMKTSGRKQGQQQQQTNLQPYGGDW